MDILCLLDEAQIKDCYQKRFHSFYKGTLALDRSVKNVIKICSQNNPN